MRDYLIVTVDYELFGDGSGCLDRCLIDPTESVLAVAEIHGVPVTLFVEALELERMVAAATGDEGRRLRRVRRQLVQAIERGHDVQLHLHTQWIGAERRGSAWRLDPHTWRIGDLDAETTRGVLETSRDWLHDWVPGSRITAFRAGGLCIRPSEHVVTALATLGFAVDSSVAPGALRATPVDGFDFRDAPTATWWRIDREVCQPARAGLLEAPIATAMLPITSRLARVAGRRLAGVQSYPAGCDVRPRRPNPAAAELWGIVQRHRSSTQLDYGVLGTDDLVRVARSWRTRIPGAGPSPVVAIGHSKRFAEPAAAALSGFLKWAATEGLVPSTLPAWASAVGEAGEG